MTTYEKFPRLAPKFLLSSLVFLKFDYKTVSVSNKIEIEKKVALLIDWAVDCCYNILLSIDLWRRKRKKQGKGFSWLIGVRRIAPTAKTSQTCLVCDSTEIFSKRRKICAFWNHSQDSSRIGSDVLVKDSCNSFRMRGLLEVYFRTRQSSVRK